MSFLQASRVARSGAILRMRATLRALRRASMKGQRASPLSALTRQGVNDRHDAGSEATRLHVACVLLVRPVALSKGKAQRVVRLAEDPILPQLAGTTSSAQEALRGRLCG